MSSIDDHMTTLPPPVQDLVVDGPFAEVRGRFARRVPAWDVDNTFDVFMYGPGVMVVRVSGRMLSWDVRRCGAGTPSSTCPARDQLSDHEPGA